jgi:Icc protein
MAAASGSTAARDSLRILQLTDTHLFASASGTLRGIDTLATLESVVSDILARAWPADIIAATGDISHDEPVGAYDRFREAVRPLGLPVFCIPGNHDSRDAMHSALSEPPFYYCRTFESGHWCVIGIDSCLAGEASGRISDEELRRLASELADTRKPHAAVCLHHPPLPMQSRWLDSVGLENADAFLDVVERAGNVRAVVFGHVHQAFDETRGTTRIIGTPSTCAQFLPRSDEFSLDVRPPAYRRISLLADGSVHTELIWIDEDE